jgi:hypothetical protein
MRLKLLSIAALAWAATAAADPAPTPDPILAYYPPAAKAAGVSGEAFVSCEHTEHGGLTNCLFTGEAPWGQGFGDAAMAIAKNAVECPEVSLSEAQRQRSTLKFTFTASPLSIAPDVTKPGWMISNPIWVRRPTGDDMAAFYPAAAHVTGMSGHATITCVATAEGHMSACQVTEERPAGWQFGAAAMKLSPIFRIRPRAPCGGSVAGAKVVIPIGFMVAPP